MARLNLTIPDPLYERLERLRDRVNVSRVCAVALEKELAMLEGYQATTENPRLQRMVQRLQRLQSLKDRWYTRGREDGEEWAAEVASPEELRQVEEEWDDDEWTEREPDHVPESFAVWEALRRWCVVDVEEAGGEPASIPSAETLRTEQAVHHRRGRRRDRRGRERDAAAIPTAQTLGRGLPETVDVQAYLRGWHHAVRDLWAQASRVLPPSEQEG